MICRRCGHKNKADFRFCEECGLSLGEKNKKPINNLFYKIKLMSTFQILGIIIVIIAFVSIFNIAGYFGRLDSQMPKVIDDFAEAVKAEDKKRLESIIISSSNQEGINPNSIDGFLLVMNISGRLDEVIKKLESDFSNIKSSSSHQSEYPISLFKTNKTGDKGYKIAVDTFDIYVGNSNALVDGVASSDGYFRNYLFGLYSVEAGVNRFQLQLDDKNPDLKDGVIVPSRLEIQSAFNNDEGKILNISIESDTQDASVFVNNEDIGKIVEDVDEFSVFQGDKIYIAKDIDGQFIKSEEIEVNKSGKIKIQLEKINLDDQDLIYNRIVEMLLEDAEMLNDRVDNYKLVTGEALEKAQNRIEVLNKNHVYFAGSYDSIRFDDDSLEIYEEHGEKKASVLVSLYYVYQTRNEGQNIDVDRLWRDDVPMEFKLIYDEAQSEWLVYEWGETYKTPQIEDKDIITIMD